MLSRTVTEEEVADVVARYDVGEALAVQPGGGTANANARVETAQGTFFLKRRNPKYADPGFVAFDHALMEHLAPQNVGTPLALKNRDGVRWSVRDALVYELFPFQIGGPHDWFSLVQLAAAGRALAAYHRATRSFVAPPGKDWPRYQDPVKIAEGVDVMGEDLRRHFLPADWAYLTRTVDTLLADYPENRYRALPRLVVHGDYHPGNVLFDGDRVCGIFDLDWATVQPRVLDLADGMFLWAGERESEIDAADIVSLTQAWTPSVARWRAFVDGYQEAETIGSEEWEALLPTVRARWLFCRVGGRVKLPHERQAEYVAHRLLEPLRALDTLETELRAGN